MVPKNEIGNLKRTEGSMVRVVCGVQLRYRKKK